MARLNHCEFIGNVGKDPVVKEFTGGSKIATLNLAITEKWKDRSGQPQEHTEWVPLVFNDGLAKTVEQYVHKGDALYVCGRMRTRSYTDAQGAQKYTTEIVVLDMQMLTKRDGAGAQAPAAAPAGPAAPVDDPDQDLPF